MLEPKKPEETRQRTIGAKLACAGRAAAVTAAIVLCAILLAHFTAPRPPAGSTNCLSNVKQIGLAMHLYAEDHDGRLPSAPGWEAQTYPILQTRQVYRCRGDDFEGDFPYATNPRFGGAKTSQYKDKGELIILYDADALGRPDARHDPRLRRARGWRYWLCTWRPVYGVNCLFMDGHAKWMQGVPDQIANGPYVAPISWDDGFWEDY